MNSLPIDIIGFMDLPEINDRWFREHYSKLLDLENLSKKPILNAELVFQKNYKRFFNAMELLNGFQMLNRIGLEELGDKDTKEIRDPEDIIQIFAKLNKQQDERKYDFKFIKDIRTP